MTASALLGGLSDQQRAPPSVAASRGHVQPELELFEPPDFDVMQVAPPDEVYIQADPGSPRWGKTGEKPGKPTSSLDLTKPFFYLTT